MAYILRNGAAISVTHIMPYSIENNPNDRETEIALAQGNVRGYATDIQDWDMTAAMDWFEAAKNAAYAITDSDAIAFAVSGKDDKWHILDHDLYKDELRFS